MGFSFALKPLHLTMAWVFRNWKWALTVLALLLVSGTIVYAYHVSVEIAAKERRYVAAWVEAEKTILSSADTASLNLASRIATENNDIPIIETDANGNPTGNFLNWEPDQSLDLKQALNKALMDFKAHHPQPIRLDLPGNKGQYLLYYYGPSPLLQEVKWYPLVQLLIVLLFLGVAFESVRLASSNAQNKLWASMAKETAHQLGTPVSSLSGWLEILKEKNNPDPLYHEMAKDIEKLQLVTDRFGKIGSIPRPEWHNPVGLVQAAVDYMNQRSSHQVEISLTHTLPQDFLVMLMPTLFQWVLENLIKNALDAMEGKGLIQVQLEKDEAYFRLSVEDNGKGIPKSERKKIFTAGFTSKQRGWGIGLTLSQRIIEVYHGGKLLLDWSEPEKGTRFLVLLPLAKTTHPNA
ncbi:MAG: sensor histidine kinase [Sphingobacteriia bacterium]|nr:MAG: sensor histidine kinase [Sphingobacteriia bacterium]